MENVFIEDISLEGYQVIRKQYFTRTTEPVMGIRKKGIAFNERARAALNHCENIRFLINDEEKRIVVQPVTSNDSDAVRWNIQSAKSKSASISSASFAKRIREQWKLDETLNYRLLGRLVKNDRKLMLLFELANSEVYPAQKVGNCSEE